MRHGRFGLTAVLLASAAVLAACGGHGGEGKDCPGGALAKTPSGYCVPRYVSLKRAEVFARKGPGKDYPAAFVYHAQGMPVQVIDETTDWRRICDPQGTASWVHRSMVDGRRTVMNVGQAAAPLRRFAKDGAGAAAYLNAQALAVLGECKGDWCKVSVGDRSGWVHAGEVWGVAPAAQCR